MVSGLRATTYPPGQYMTPHICQHAFCCHAVQDPGIRESESSDVSTTKSDPPICIPEGAETVEEPTSGPQSVHCLK
eukprot:scaffold652282_cov51-Prasinocladus_malaysianus.AAC.1